jgi:hypothetical protein
MLPRQNNGRIVMIFRALLAIGVVSLLTPHEPDLGLGRPGAGASLPSPALSQSAHGLSRTKDACGIPACAGALALAGFLGFTPREGRTLKDVQAEIAADQAARKSAF